MSKPLTYHINYGFVGGPRKSKAMRRHLQSAGLQQAESANTADIIIAHSAGCWEISDSAQPRLVVYIGLPLADPTLRTSLKSNAQTFGRVIGAGHFKHLRRHVTLSMYYLAREPRRNMRIIRRAKQLKVKVFPDAQSVMIMNQHDPWPRAPELGDLMQYEAWAYVGLPGTHDSIWEDSQLYAQIIEHYARLLA